MVLSLSVLIGACGEERPATSSPLQKTYQEASAAVKEWLMSEGQSVLLTPNTTLNLIKIRKDSACMDTSLCFRDGNSFAEFLLNTPKQRRTVRMTVGKTGQDTLFVDGIAIEIRDIYFAAGKDQQGSTNRVLLRQTPAQSKLDLFKHLEGLRLASLYSHQLGIFELEFIHGEVALIRDPNRCWLDAFGERFACTKMAIFRTRVGLRFMEQSQNKYLFQLTGVEGYFFVVDHSYPIKSYRLIIHQDDKEFVEALMPIQRIKQIPSLNGRD